jgi:hypothetical protein
MSHEQFGGAIDRICRHPSVSHRAVYYGQGDAIPHARVIVEFPG